MKRNFFGGNNNTSNSFDKEKRTLFNNTRANENTKTPNSESEDYSQKSYEKYSGMDKNQLLQELVAEVQKSKKNGTFDPKRIEQTISSLSPFLSKEQISMMEDLLGRIK
ncbi:MAG: hypothetical protein WCR30_01080 [Clostridia bacterium]